MALPKEATTDMADNYDAAKKKTLDFYLIPQKSAPEAPWLIVDKPATAKTRFKAARELVKKKFRAQFNLAKADQGSVHKKDSVLVFVLAKAPNSQMEKMLTTRWAVALKEADKRFAVLLRAADIVVDEAFELATYNVDTAARDKVYAKERADLSPTELKQFFAGDAVSVTKTLPKHVDLGRVLELDTYDGDKEAKSVQAVVKQLIDVDLFDNADSAVAEFLQMAHARQSKAVERGEKVETADLMASFAAEFNDWWRVANWVDFELTAIEDLGEELEEMEDGAEKVTLAGQKKARVETVGTVLDENVRRYHELTTEVTEMQQKLAD